MPDFLHPAMGQRTGTGLGLLLCLSLCACSGAPSQRATEIHFAFGGDLAGQNVCRDEALGFPIFEHVLKSQPAFFIGLGDMIYADNPCKAIGLYGNDQIPLDRDVASTIEEFRARWRYVAADPGFARLLKDVPYFAVWDDHEVRNDFGPHDDLAAGSADLHLMPAGREAFAEFTGADDGQLYFMRSFAGELEIFFLDTRSYRDPNSAIDDPASPKTMLGEKQREWLLDGVRASNARWKVIVSSVPLSIPTGWPAENGRDGWADFDQDTGFELELLAILRAFAEAGVNNLVWLSADVHFATGFRYRPFDSHPEFTMHEFVTGPLQAGLFPNTEVDETLRPERLFYHAPPSADAPGSFPEARSWFNFGLIRIGIDGRLQFRLIDGYGEARAAVALMPDPPPSANP